MKTHMRAPDFCTPANVMRVPINRNEMNHVLGGKIGKKKKKIHCEILPGRYDSDVQPRLPPPTSPPTPAVPPNHGPRPIPSIGSSENSVIV